MEQALGILKEALVDLYYLSSKGKEMVYWMVTIMYQLLI